MNSFDRFAQKLFRNLPLIFGITILSMDLVSLLAPVFAHLGLETIAHYIYTVYGFLCHQRPWRSIHIFDYQMAWCSRDTFIYLSMGLSAIFATIFRIRGVKWYVALLCVVPFALDGLIQMFAEISGVLGDNMEFFYASTNFLRMLTGSIFGTGAGLWLFGMLDETIEEEIILKNSKTIEKKAKKGNFKRNLKFFLSIVVICIVTYIGLVRVWDMTSEKYKPHGLLDHKRYFPGINYEEVDRGGHGV